MTHDSRGDAVAQGLDRDEVAAFFDTLGVAMASFDGAGVARHLGSTLMLVGGDGASEVLTTRAEVVARASGIVDAHRASGARSYRTGDMVLAPTGPAMALATVTLEWLGDAGRESTERAASHQESWHLRRVDGRIEAFVWISPSRDAERRSDAERTSGGGDERVATLPCLDHVYLTVSDLARSVAFYDPIFRALGLRKTTRSIAGEPHVHYVAPALQMSLRPAHSSAAHDPYAPGLHHLCLQLEDASAVDRAHASLVSLGVEASPPAQYPQYTPGYYATFFADPDGLRLELVARTAYRDRLARSFATLRHFQNPLAALAGERDGVYHIAAAAELDAARAVGVYRPASLDAEGFIHCSTRTQVLETASRFFRGRTDLWLVELDAHQLGERLVYELGAPPSPIDPDALFPHLYAELPLDLVVAAAPFTESGGDGFVWPDAMVRGSLASDR